MTLKKGGDKKNQKDVFIQKKLRNKLAITTIVFRISGHIHKKMDSLFLLPKSEKSQSRVQFWSKVYENLSDDEHHRYSYILGVVSQKHLSGLKYG